MSLYSLQKILYQLNRDAAVRKHYEKDFDGLLREYDLTPEEIDALRKPDIGLLYVLGVNGQLLMHYAALCGYAWPQYIEAMKQGVRDHGPVRAGIYTMVED
jgi:hypothetical protein